mmetsp:Transcript_39107/g.83215  ORF Transcript_39107/g.83215 Transcript_39107/m.83215 type:complete len:478 (-) Transcript_39107:601-2034(-)|eukprot:CAMPEP_0206464686 /NCGR_PEP_ID=MMETSP0324_2-20121206/27363_1 /ASSEMBLY_ACC=CAM_ASM_000836 /TAXON_ID=2866 /ORGANISM="Crypthecodinium cohnii, Strain Seligo" /LENGTH=477 /DNA_ID=CAMNT_0053937363 /DNA_START=137 /DNA_END=1570 /DNA_ORIENTATION=+
MAPSSPKSDTPKKDPKRAASEDPNRLGARANVRAQSAARGRKATKNTIFMDIDMDAFAHRVIEKSKKQKMQKVSKRRNVIFDEKLGKAEVAKELKFKKRWYGVDKVDDPTAEAASDISAFKAVAQDLALLYKAFPGECELTRLRKAHPPGTYTEDRNAWGEELALNEGDFLKGLLVEEGVPADDIKVEVAFASSTAPLGMFVFTLPVDFHAEEKANNEDAINAAVQKVVSRKNVSFDIYTGRCGFMKALSWAPRSANGAKMDPPDAQLTDPMSADQGLRDMAEIWHLFQSPAKIQAEPPAMVHAEADVDEWCKALARNRAALIKKVLIHYKVPADMLQSGAFGDALMARRRSFNTDPDDYACTVTAPAQSHADTDKAERLRVRMKLRKAAAVHKVEDIHILEEAIQEARSLRLEEQWTRVDPLLSEASKTLQILHQRRRRVEAYKEVANRSKALTHIKVSQATKQTMLETGELRETY